MKQVTIQPFSITTTKTGFGCSSLVGMLSPKEGRALVDAAYDSGIRHFDVARSYGRGIAESVLGRALGGRRSSVTITSKFGIPVPRQRVSDYARIILRPVAKRIPTLRSQPGSLPGAAIEHRDFSRRNAELSLDATLQQLGTDYLDILLLHEASAEALTDPGLLDFLGNARKTGKIRGYGVGTQTPNIPGLIADNPRFCPIVQHEWSPLVGDIDIPSSSFRITHGSLARVFQLLYETFSKNKNIANSAIEAVRMDITAEQNLSALLLRSAAIKHPNSITLFSSRTLERIRQNAQALADDRLDTPSEALADFIAANRSLLLRG